MAVALSLRAGDTDADGDGAGPTSPSSAGSADVAGPDLGAVETDASVAVEAMSAAYADGDRVAFVAAAGATRAARTFATGVWQSLVALDVERLDLSVVDAVESDGRAVADLDVAWSTGPDSVLGASVSPPVTVALDVDGAAGRIELVGLEADDDPLPLWAAGGVDVTRSDGVAVVRVGPGGSAATDLDAAARLARRDVARTPGLVPSAASGVIVSAGDATTASSLVAGSGADLTRLAALATVLGDPGPDAPTAVVVSPDVLASSSPRDRRVVLAHELVHQLTDAVGSGAELWVLEGVADWAALRDDPLGLDVRAAQIADVVEVEGVPTAPPTAADFDAASTTAGAAYEAAWLLVDTLARLVGDAAVVRFYADVVGGADVATALRTAGTDLDTLVARWGATLRTLP